MLRLLSRTPRPQSAGERERFAPRPGRQLLLAATLVALVLFLTGAGLAVQNYRRAQDREVAATAALASATAANTESFLLDRLATLQALASAPPLRSGDLAAVQAYVVPLVPAGLGFSGSVGWIDRGGQLRALSAQAPDAPPIDLTDRDYVRSVLATDRPYVGQGLLSRVSANPVVVLAVPTHDGDGAPNGVLFGSIRLDRLEASSQGLRFAGSVKLIDRSGQILVDGGAVTSLESVANKPLLDRLRNERQGALVGVAGLRGESNRLIGFAPVPTGEWLALIDQPLGEALAPARRTLVVELLVLLAVSLLSVAVASGAARRFSRLAAAGRATERQYRTLAEVAPVGIFHADADGKFTYVNEYWCILTGLPAQAMLGQHWNRMVTPEDRAQISAAWEQAQRDRQPFQAEFRLRTDDSAVVWVLGQATAERNAAGAVIGYVGTITDITARKGAEERERLLVEVSTTLAGTLDVREALERLVHLLVPRQADWCIISTLENGDTIHRRALAHADPAQEAVLRQLQRQYPYAPERGWGIMRVISTGQAAFYPHFSEDDWATQIRPEDAAIHRRLGMASVLIVPLRARGRTLGAFRLVRATAERPYEEADLALAVQIADRAAVAIDSAQLFTGERAARARAEAAQRRLTFLAEAGVTLAGSLDRAVTLAALADLVVPDFADWCTINVLGDDKSGDEGELHALVARHADAAKQPALDQLLRRYPLNPTGTGALATVLQTGRGMLLRPEPDELPAYAPNAAYLALLGTVGFGSTIIVPLFAHGRLLGALRFVREGTSQQYDDDDLALAEELARRTGLAIDNARLYREAQEAVAARDNFLSVAAHELRTPVTGVRAYVQLLRLQQSQGQLTPARLATAIEAVERGTSRLTTLIRDLLDVARLRGGQFSIRRDTVELVALIEAVVAQERLSLGDSLHLVAELPPPPCNVSGDAARLEQVLSNLLENARKYSPEGGAITLSLERDDDGAVVTVRDEGIGLDPGEAEAIFTPFNRSRAALARQIPGLGLGLAIARSIVEQHDGQLWATSEGAGRGTTFVLRLPLLAIPEEAAAGSRGPEVASGVPEAVGQADE